PRAKPWHFLRHASPAERLRRELVRPPTASQALLQFGFRGRGCVRAGSGHRRNRDGSEDTGERDGPLRWCFPFPRVSTLRREARRATPWAAWRDSSMTGRRRRLAWSGIAAIRGEATM